MKSLLTLHWSLSHVSYQSAPQMHVIIVREIIFNDISLLDCFLFSKGVLQTAGWWPPTIILLEFCACIILWSMYRRYGCLQHWRDPLLLLKVFWLLWNRLERLNSSLNATLNAGGVLGKQAILALCWDWLQLEVSKWSISTMYKGWIIKATQPHQTPACFTTWKNPPCSSYPFSVVGIRGT